MWFNPIGTARNHSLLARASAQPPSVPTLTQKFPAPRSAASLPPLSTSLLVMGHTALRLNFTNNLRENTVSAEERPRVGSLGTRATLVTSSARNLICIPIYGYNKLIPSFVTTATTQCGTPELSGIASAEVTRKHMGRGQLLWFSAAIAVSDNPCMQTQWENP